MEFLKKIGLSVFLLAGAFLAQAAEPAVVTGVWNRGTKVKEKEVKLYRVESGRTEEVASYLMDEDFRFGFAFDPKADGFYVIGSGNPKAPKGKYLFYFKPGDRLEVSVDEDGYTLTGTKNSPENKALADWHKYILLMELRSVYFNNPAGFVNGGPSTYVDFFPMLEDLAKKVPAYKALKTNNPVFDKWFAKFRDYDFLRYAYAFVLTPRNVHPELEDYPDFYRNVDVAQLTSTTDLLHYPFGVSLMQNSLHFADLFSANPSAPGKSGEKMIATVKNETLKGEIAVELAGRVKTYDAYLQFHNEYGKYIITPDQKERYVALTAKLAKSDNAMKTFDFSGYDLDGKKVSLSDLKGKVVYVDVWATWCGPCKKEIPFLKELEKQYHGVKDIVFMSISVDEAKNKQKWIDFVKKEELVGMQLFAGNGLSSEVSKLYNITAIPRFMLFGKDGKIVTDDAIRPSNPNIKNILDEQLVKQ